MTFASSQDTTEHVPADAIAAALRQTWLHKPFGVVNFWGTSVFFDRKELDCPDESADYEADPADISKKKDADPDAAGKKKYQAALSLACSLISWGSGIAERPKGSRMNLPYFAAL